MNGFLKYLSNKKQDLTILEGRVLDFIIQSPDSIINTNISDVAKATFVSTATISRTCKKLGFGGFVELKYALIQSEGKYNYSPNQILSTNSAIEYLHQVQSDLQSNESHIYSIDYGHIIRMLKNSRRIELFGIGRSYSTCQEAARKLSFAGCLANARSDWDELRSISGYLKENDLAILISLSGETIQILNIASILSSKDIPTLAIIGTKNSSLGEIVTNNIELNIRPVRYKNIDMSSNFIFSILFDILSMKYLEME